MPPPNWQGVLIDTHIYQMFSDAVRTRFDTIEATTTHILRIRITHCRMLSISRPHALKQALLLLLPSGL